MGPCDEGLGGVGGGGGVSFMEKGCGRVISFCRMECKYGNLFGCGELFALTLI